MASLFFSQFKEKGIIAWKLVSGGYMYNVPLFRPGGTPPCPCMVALKGHSQSWIFLRRRIFIHDNILATSRIFSRLVANIFTTLFHDDCCHSAMCMGSGQLCPKPTRSQSTPSQVNSDPSQLGPKSTLVLYFLYFLICI